MKFASKRRLCRLQDLCVSHTLEERVPYMCWERKSSTFTFRTEQLHCLKARSEDMIEACN